MFTNPLLLWGIAFELAFAAAIIYLPPLQPIFDTRRARAARELAVLATFPVIVWGVDELRRWWLRRRPGRCADVGNCLEADRQDARATHS